MSERFPGGFMTQSPPTPSASNATGIWTLDQQEQLKQAGQWPPNGPFFIEDVFSTWVYTGNGTTQTITNGIDLAGKGGLVWMKDRTTAYSHILVDTVRGAANGLSSNTTGAQFTNVNSLTSFNANGFTVNSGNSVNQDTDLFASWTFREQPKFFDVVTWTADGTDKVIPHNLGSEPGFVIFKKTSGAQNWYAYHRDLGTSQVLFPNLTSAATVSGSPLYTFTSTTFTTLFGNLKDSGDTYVAYLFAHNAGGFGLSGTDNVISCGSFTTNGSGAATVNLGYEAQWVMMKRSDGVEGWWMTDNMRGNSLTSYAYLYANASDAEVAGSGTYVMAPTATGFLANNLNASANYIYIAIRRGPMRTPTTGTSVFEPVAYTGNDAYPITIGSIQSVDMSLNKARNQAGSYTLMTDRLRGGSVWLATSDTIAEQTLATPWTFGQSGLSIASLRNSSSFNYVNYNFRRAPGFFDEVCYTGSGTTTTQPHNLGVVPELIIVKRRNAAANWQVYSATYGRNFYAFLDLTQGFASDPGNAWGTTDPTSTTFSLSPLTETNASGSTYVAYLFASVPGVSKVGSYTGTGTTQTINCGFTGGARFVMIKRGDSTGDWFVWDTARGMIPANDPYLRLNSTAAEVTGTDFVDTAATGFEITSTAPAAINASGGTFLYLAIA